MIEKDMVRPRQAGVPSAPADRGDGSAAQIVAELDQIVSRSGQRLLPRRGFRRMGRALARWFDNLVPPAAPSVDTEPPPHIRFPFF